MLDKLLTNRIPDRFSSPHDCLKIAYGRSKLAPLSLGLFDPARILIIGEADEDSPIALDYRTDNPRVVYLGRVRPQLVWIELESNYGGLFAKLTAWTA
jgi:hypothetical protein